MNSQLGAGHLYWTLLGVRCSDRWNSICHSAHPRLTEGERKSGLNASSRQQDSVYCHRYFTSTTSLFATIPSSCHSDFPNSLDYSLNKFPVSGLKVSALGVRSAVGKLESYWESPRVYCRVMKWQHRDAACVAVASQHPGPTINPDFSAVCVTFVCSPSDHAS